jgi:hypothetical protein
MHRSVKAAAVIAALGLVTVVGASAAPRSGMLRGGDATAGGGVRGGMGGGPLGSGGGHGVGRGMMDGRAGGGPGTRGMRGDLPGWQDLPKLDKTLTVDTAKERVVSALKDWGYAELAVDAVAAYQDGFYAVAKDKTSGKAALELYVDADYGMVSAAGVAGWNTKYGRSLAWPLASGASITAEEAKKLAQDWLDRSRTTVKYELKVVELPGYYSVQMYDAGKLAGLVAVNAYTRQVWYRGGCGGRFTEVVGPSEG